MAQLVECLGNVYKALDLALILHKLCSVELDCNFSTLEVETGGSEV